jgi:hypothetical protein
MSNIFVLILPLSTLFVFHAPPPLSFVPEIYASFICYVVLILTNVCKFIPYRFQMGSDLQLFRYKQHVIVSVDNHVSAGCLLLIEYSLKILHTKCSQHNSSQEKLRKDTKSFTENDVAIPSAQIVFHGMKMLGYPSIFPFNGYWGRGKVNWKWFYLHSLNVCTYFVFHLALSLLVQRTALECWQVLQLHVELHRQYSPIFSPL